MSDTRARLVLLDEFARRYNQHDVDAIMECMTDDCVFVSFFGTEPFGDRFTGADRVRERVASFLEDWPDARWDDARHFVAEDRGFTEWRFTGTMSGTNQPVERYGCDLFTFRADKIYVKDTYQKWRLDKADGGGDRGHP